MTDFTSVPTVELLTRAADAAGKAAATISRLEVQSRVTWVDGVDRLVGMSGPRKSLAMASGPDHWRAVEALLRAVIKEHSPVTVYSDSRRLDSVRVCKTCGGSDAYFEQSGTPAMRMAAHPCPTLKASRPLAEQVLQHLGDTE